MVQLEYHKGEWCPYAEKTGRALVFCQEGFCHRCQIWYDFSRIERIEVASKDMKGVSVSDCPLGLKVCYPSCYWWRDGNCTFEEADNGEA